MDPEATSTPGSLEREEEVIKDRSPDGRYCHYGEKLGSGAFKTVYMAFDRETGTQLAWNQIVLDHNIGADEFKRIYKEISILKQISHESIIKLYDSWIDEEKGNLIFVTEAMTSGTLAQFRKRLPQVSLTVVQNWARQLLTGLDYLHTRNPVIMHRDIKSGNIFMDATAEANRVKIGDLGLATLYTGSLQAEQMSVIGTPEYMAPEFYSESYNQLVDIWAFGLVMLEMISNQVPYAECNGATAQIFIKVSRGTLPATFHDILPGPCKDFIAACLLPASVRPSAAELLEAPFLTMKVEGATDLVYNYERASLQSPAVGRGQNPLSRGAGGSSLRSPRESQVSPTPPASGGMGGGFDNNTTQNLIRNKANQFNDGGADDAPPEPSSLRPPGANVVQPIAQKPNNGNNGNQIESKPGSPEDRSSLNSSSDGIDHHTRDRTHTAPPPIQRSGSVDIGDLGGGGDNSSSNGSKIERAPKFLPLSLSVNGVDDDRISFCLCALRSEIGGVREKKVNFVFDVSTDEVDGDAQGLVEANRPDFELKVSEVSDLLALRIAENMHKTALGRRLRLQPTSLLPPTKVSDMISTPPRGGGGGSPQGSMNQFSPQSSASQSNDMAVFHTPGKLSQAVLMEQPSPQVFSTPVPVASHILGSAMIPQSLAQHPSGRSFQQPYAEHSQVHRRPGHSDPPSAFPHIQSASAPDRPGIQMNVPPTAGGGGSMILTASTDIDQRSLEMLEKFSSEKNILGDGTFGTQEN